MANEKNLVRGSEAHKLTAEEASRGGKRSGEVRRERRDLRRAMEALLDKTFKGKNGEELSGAEAIAVKQFEKALRGDAKAFELVRDTSGQKPVDKVMTVEINQDIIDEVEQAVLGDNADGQKND